MRILGIDPGIERTGFAVLEGTAQKFSLLDFGLIRTDKKFPLSTRLSQLAKDLKEILIQWKPDVAGIEEIFFSKNVKTAMTVSHARGVILETLEEHGVAIIPLNPSHVKLAVTGDSRADKWQIKKMVQYLAGVSLKSDDTADAIAAAIAACQGANSLRV